MDYIPGQRDMVIFNTLIWKSMEPFYIDNENKRSTFSGVVVLRIVS